jgi:hypothetical protein
MFKVITGKTSKSLKASLLMLHVVITVLMYRYKLAEYRFEDNITFSVIAQEKWISVELAWQGSCV